MSDSLEALSARIGRFGGHGLDYEERPFHGDFAMEALPGDLGVAYTFRAVGIDGAVYRDERGWIAPDDQGRVALWAMHAGSVGIRRHAMRNGAPAEGVEATFVFGVGDPADVSGLRVEFALDLLPEGELAYRVAGGEAGAAFRTLWSVRMQPEEG